MFKTVCIEGCRPNAYITLNYPQEQMYLTTFGQPAVDSEAINLVAIKNNKAAVLNNWFEIGPN